MKRGIGLDAFSKTNTQTFTLLRTFIKKVLISQNLSLRLKRTFSGYVPILILALIPVLLFGTKYILDLRVVNKVSTSRGNQQWHKRCAKEAALAVAKNWNPGLSFERQKAAAYKVADVVYSVKPFTNGSAIRQAISGLDVKTYRIIEDVPENPITYNYVTRYRNRLYYGQSDNTGTTWNPNYMLWYSVDKNTDPTKRHSEYDEINKLELKKGDYVLKHHDIFKNPSIAKLPALGELCSQINETYYPNNNYYTSDSNGLYSQFVVEVLSDNSNNQYYLPDTYGLTGIYASDAYIQDKSILDPKDSDEYYEPQ